MRRLAAADALVSATSYEGLPHVVIEALVCGTPVITTPAGGVVEVIADGDNGRLVDPADASAFAALFEELRADADLRTRMSAGAARAGQEWGFDRCADEIEGLLTTLGGGGDRRRRHPDETAPRAARAGPGPSTSAGPPSPGPRATTSGASSPSTPASSASCRSRPGRSAAGTWPASR